MLSLRYWAESADDGGRPCNGRTLWELEGGMKCSDCMCGDLDYADRKNEECEGEGEERVLGVGRRNEHPLPLHDSGEFVFCGVLCVLRHSYPLVSVCVFLKRV